MSDSDHSEEGYRDSRDDRRKRVAEEDENESLVIQPPMQGRHRARHTKHKHEKESRKRQAHYEASIVSEKYAKVDNEDDDRRREKSRKERERLERIQRERDKLEKETKRRGIKKERLIQLNRQRDEERAKTERSALRHDKSKVNRIDKDTPRDRRLKEDRLRENRERTAEQRKPDRSVVHLPNEGRSSKQSTTTSDLRHIIDRSRSKKTEQLRYVKEDRKHFQREKGNEKISASMGEHLEDISDEDEEGADRKRRGKVHYSDASDNSYDSEHEKKKLHLEDHEPISGNSEDDNRDVDDEEMVDDNDGDEDGDDDDDDDDEEDEEEDEDEGKDEVDDEDGDQEEQNVNDKDDDDQSDSLSDEIEENIRSKFEDDYGEAEEEEEEDETSKENVEAANDLTTERHDGKESAPLTAAEQRRLLPPYLPAIMGCRNVDEFNCLNRIEEGTYGVVYRAQEKKTGEIVALKRLKMEREKEGFPITSLREIDTLLKAQHNNIVTVREIVVGSNIDKIYIVMDYVEHDLKSLMEMMNEPFMIGEVKCLMQQLLRGVAHMHDNWIIHRDLKTSNLLLSHKGILKIGDFGLAREYGSPLKRYTSVVVTLWYRAPELLLGAKEYSTHIDLWSVGCIMAEFLKTKPLFPGTSDIDQINKIFKELGTPTESIWAGVSELPSMKKCNFTVHPYNNLRKRFGTSLSNKGFTYLNRFLTYNPKKRVTAEEALTDEYFDESPYPIPPDMFPTWPAKSEQSRRVEGNSPKPPSGGKAYSKLLDENDDVSGFYLGKPKGGTAALRDMFSLKY